MNNNKTSLENVMIDYPIIILRNRYCREDSRVIDEILDYHITSISIAYGTTRIISYRRLLLDYEWSVDGKAWKFFQDAAELQESWY